MAETYFSLFELRTVPGSEMDKRNHAQNFGCPALPARPKSLSCNVWYHPISGTFSLLLCHTRAHVLLQTSFVALTDGVLLLCHQHSPRPGPGRSRRRLAPGVPSADNDDVHAGRNRLLAAYDTAGLRLCAARGSQGRAWASLREPLPPPLVLVLLMLLLLPPLVQWVRNSTQRGGQRSTCYPAAAAATVAAANAAPAERSEQAISCGVHRSSAGRGGWGRSRGGCREEGLRWYESRNVRTGISYRDQGQCDCNQPGQRGRRRGRRGESRHGPLSTLSGSGRAALHGVPRSWLSVCSRPRESLLSDLCGLTAGA